MAAPRDLFRSVPGRAAYMAWYDDVQARIPGPVESRRVPTRLGETHVLSAGRLDAPPLVLVPGLGGNALLYRRQLADLAGDFRLHTLDIPGQPGKSAPARPNFHDDTIPHWLLDVFDALALERADLIGGSLGARLVIQFGAYPAGAARIRRVVLFSPIGLARVRLSLTWRFTAMVLNPARRSNGLHGLLRWGLALPPDGPLDADTARVLEGFVLGFQHARQDIAPGLSLIFPLPAATLRAFRLPTLLLIGEQERLFDPARLIALAQGLWGDRVTAEAVPGMGHNLVVQHNPVVDARIKAFLLG